MKRFLMLVGVAVVGAAMYVAASPASQQANGPTARQFNALKKQVAALKKDETNVKKLAVAEAGLLVACAKVAIPIDQFGDSTNQTQGYRYAPTGRGADPATTDMLTTALDAAASTDTNAVWFMGGDSSCGTAMGGSSALRHAAAGAGLRLPHASPHQAFAAHQP
jgi:hypothetical protein